MSLKAILNAFRIIYDDGVGARVLERSTTLNNAQIKALFHPTPIELVPAPVSGYRLRPCAVSFSTHIQTAGAYTNINATYADIHIGANTDYTVYGPVDDPTTSPPLDALTRILGTVGDTVFDPQAPNQIAVGTGNLYVQTISVEDKANVNAAALTIYGENNGSSDLTGGHASNTMKVTVYYVVEAL